MISAILVFLAQLRAPLSGASASRLVRRRILVRGTTRAPFARGPLYCGFDRVVCSPNPNIQLWLDYDSLPRPLPLYGQPPVQFCFESLRVWQLRPAASKSNTNRACLKRRRSSARTSGPLVRAPPSRPGCTRNSSCTGRIPSASGRHSAPLSANCAFLSATRTTRSVMQVSQLSIPEAKSTPKSGLPFFHSRNAGWRSPEMMSVAPLVSLAKQSTSRGSSMFNATGLCVASSTCPR